MTAAFQQATSQSPAPPPVIDGDALARRINDAVEQAVSQATQGATGTRDLRETIRQAVDEARAQADAARQQGGVEITIPPRFEPTIPPEAVDISLAFFAMVAFVIVGLPLARAFARRMDRRGAAAPASDLAPRLDRIEQAIEAIAIEVERVSEGQRYTTRAISEIRALPGANPLGSWPAGAREGERAPAPAEAARRP